MKMKEMSKNTEIRIRADKRNEMIAKAISINNKLNIIKKNKK
jgi:hypothetical protein